MSTHKNAENEKNDDNGEREEPASPSRSRFVPPTLEQAEAEAVHLGMPKEQGQAFIDHHETSGWNLKRGKMVSWRAAMRTWLRHWKSFPKSNHIGNNGRSDKNYEELDNPNSWEKQK